jgi:prevent-host-death family protein
VDKIVSAAEANRRFSQLLRDVREGGSYVVTAHGRPVAKIVPIRSDDTARKTAREVLLTRLRAQPAIDDGRWTREELYEEGVNGAERQQAALALLGRLSAEDVALPVQVLGELFQVLTRKASRPPAAARSVISAWRDAFPLLDTSASVLLAAADLAADHRLFIWDAVILSAAAHAGCRLLLSEDMQDGFGWSGVTVTNPFAASRHPLLAAVIAGPPS